MNRLEYLQKIERYFAYLIAQVKVSNSFGHYDINSVAEDFYIPILEYLYECKELENKNVIKYNFPAIDLGCEITKKSFQITSESGSGKIVHTLEEFRGNNLHEKYDEVFILIITTKQNSYSSKKLDAEIKQQKINFDKDLHIIDYTDLISKIKKLSTEPLEEILKILEAEFTKKENYNVRRSELDGFLSISTNKIEIEKNTKKYIPAIFTETTQTKDNARLFSHPLFFYRKIEDVLLEVNYTTLNDFLEKMGLENLESDIPEFIKSHTSDSLEKVSNYLEQLKNLIEKEKDKIFPYNSWYQGEKRVEFEVPPEKQAMKSILKLRREEHCAWISRKYDKALEMIQLSLSNVLLITSMAGQGKTNFVCDLVENQFTAFEIPSVFIPARELNFCETPMIFNHLIKNKYLSKIPNQYELLGFFDQVAKEINKPFVIVIDGINEVKDLEQFNSQLIDFLNAVNQFNFVKVIITCRSEFFEQRFSEVLKQPFSEKIYHVEDLKSEMSEGNLDRILEFYLEHFSIGARFSEEAANFLKDDLLLLRIFCELNKEQKIGAVEEIYKDQLYEKYLIARIEAFDKKLQKKVLPIFHSIAQRMIADDQYASLVLKDYDDEQLHIIEQLVSEDIILRRELPEGGLGNVGDEAVGFTYDELRDFIIAHYLINSLSESSFEEFSNFLSKLPSLPIREGVFKYIYILSKKEKKEKIVTLCEGINDFELHYANIIWSMPPEYQSEGDVQKIKNILKTSKIRNTICTVSSYLFRHRNKKSFLNIDILLEHMNSLDEKKLSTFLDTIFSKGYLHEPHTQRRIDEKVEQWLEAIKDNEEKMSNESFIFWLQVASKASFWLRSQIVTSCAQLKEHGKRHECFEFISKANSSGIKNLAEAIKTYKEKNV